MELRATLSPPLTGLAEVPGDKSCSHRALILGAMAQGETHIANLLESEDVMATARAIAAFGATVSRRGDGMWIVTGRSTWSSPTAPVDCGNSGTTARLLLGAAAGFPLEARFAGDSSLSRRPMAELIEVLSMMGAEFSSGDHLPLTVRGQSLGGIDWRNDPASAQLKSAILLAGLRASGPVIVREPVPTRDHSEIMLRQFGCEVVNSADGVALGTRRALRGQRIAIAADPSSAAFPFTAAAIVPGGAVEVRGMLVNPLRMGLLDKLRQMGARVELSDRREQSGEQVATMRVSHAGLAPVRVEPSEVPSMIDEIPLLAVAAAFAKGESVIAGLGSLRHKESDRLAAIAGGLTQCGVDAAVKDDCLRIVGNGQVRGGARVATQGDHRIAMAFLVLGLAAEEPVIVDSAEMIATSFPGFVAAMRRLGANIE